MQIRFIIPNDQADKINGFLGSQTQKLRLIAGEIYEKRGIKFDRRKFLSGRANFGAVLVGPDKAAICAALTFPDTEPDILEGMTESEYAQHVKKSRQFIHKAVKTGKIKSFKVGRTSFVDTAAEREEELEARQGGGENV